MTQKAIKPLSKKAAVIFPVSNRKGMSAEKVKDYSDILLRGIKRELSDAIFFTREDLLKISSFGHVTTMYRYSMFCVLLRHLISRGDIIEKTRTDLCLKDHAEAYSDIPLRERYFDTIYAVLCSSFRPGARFAVMEIVDHWKTDADLTTNNKRVAVRGALQKLVKDGRLARTGDFQYVRK